MINVLLIEDHPAIAFYIGESLSACPEPYNVLIAENGTDALSILETKNCNLVIMDLALPDYDGVELIPKIAAANKPPLIIVFTAR